MVPQDFLVDYFEFNPSASTEKYSRRPVRFCKTVNRRLSIGRPRRMSGIFDWEKCSITGSAQCTLWWALSCFTNVSSNLSCQVLPPSLGCSLLGSMWKHRGKQACLDIRISPNSIQIISSDWSRRHLRGICVKASPLRRIHKRVSCHPETKRRMRRL